MTPLRLHLAMVLLVMPVGGFGAEPKWEPSATGQTQPLAIPLIRADAEYVAARLKMLLGPSVKTFTDKESNTVFVYSDTKGVARAKVLIAKLDSPRVNVVVQLTNADPISIACVAKVLIDVLAFLGNDPEVWLVPLERDRMIFFTATQEQAKWLRWLIRQLDQPW